MTIRNRSDLSSGFPHAGQDFGGHPVGGEYQHVDLVLELVGRDEDVEAGHEHRGDPGQRDGVCSPHRHAHQLLLFLPGETENVLGGQ
ncbi:hypothetical protein AB0L88_05910 [Saccharopolyspora shandongensis]|uniref:hypothetical protein n=1 Tax=Saccharopolyspora shandongensis TaxID=418495 RepID=UPI00342F0B99